MKRSRFSEEQIIAILKEQENGFLESFNGSFRDECLNERLFWSLTDARHYITISKGITDQDALSCVNTKAMSNHAVIINNHAIEEVVPQTSRWGI